MRIQRVCVFNGSDLERMYRRVNFRISMTEYLNAIQNDKINKFRVSDLKEIIDFMNDNLGNHMRIRKDGRKQVIVDRVRSNLYTGGSTHGSSNRASLGTNNKQEKVLSLIQKDLTVCNHHPFYHPMESVKGVMVFDNGVYRKKNIIFIDFTDNEYAELRRQNVEFHAYCLRNNVPNNPLFETFLDFEPQNWPKHMSFLFNKHRMNIPECNEKLEHNHQHQYNPSKPKKNYFILNRAMKINPTYLNPKRNKIEISFPHYARSSVIVYFSIVHKEKNLKQIWDLVNTQTKINVQKKQITNNNTNNTQNNNNNKMKDDEDDDLEISGDEVVTLTDPLLLTKIEAPTRGQKCSHLQVFDLQVYLDYTKRSECSNCPICSRPLPFSELEFDYFVKYILDHVDEEIEKVKVNLDEKSFTPIHPISRKELKKKSFPAGVGIDSEIMSEENNNNNNNIKNKKMDDEEEEIEGEEVDDYFINLEDDSRDGPPTPQSSQQRHQIRITENNNNPPQQHQRRRSHFSTVRVNTNPSLVRRLNTNINNNNQGEASDIDLSSSSSEESEEEEEEEESQEPGHVEISSIFQFLQQQGEQQQQQRTTTTNLSRPTNSTNSTNISSFQTSAAARRRRPNINNANNFSRIVQSVAGRNNNINNRIRKRFYTARRISEPTTPVIDISSQDSSDNNNNNNSSRNNNNRSSTASNSGLPGRGTEYEPFVIDD